MIYRVITGTDRENILVQEVASMEAEHYKTTIALIAAKAAGGDVSALENKMRALEAAIDAVVPFERPEVLEEEEVIEEVLNTEE